jgi:hypothetical protein
MADGSDGKWQMDLMGKCIGSEDSTLLISTEIWRKHFLGAECRLKPPTVMGLSRRERDGVAPLHMNHIQGL